MFSNSECELCNCHLQFGASGGGTCQALFFSIASVDNSNTNYATITFLNSIRLYDIRCATFPEALNDVCARNFKTIDACTCILSDNFKATVLGTYKSVNWVFYGSFIAQSDT